MMRLVARALCVLGLIGSCLLGSLASSATALIHPAIVGGTPASIAQAPWQVAIEATVPGGGSLLCGGSIVDASHILTAAHCVFDSSTLQRIPPQDFTVVAGTADLGSGSGASEEERAVTEVRPHPYYSYAPASGEVGADDVALLTLEEPLTLGASVATIPLVAPGTRLAEGTSVNLTGFGEENTNTDELDGKLYSLGMTTAFSRECGGPDNAVLICASSAAGSPCSGDSGSALTVGSPSMMVGVEDAYLLEGEQRCSAGALNALANIAAPEIQEFIDGSETPPRAPRGGGAIIRAIPTTGHAVTCEPGTWSGNPTYTYAFVDSLGQVLQQGPSSTYALTAADIGRAILCEIEAANGGGTGVGRTPALRAITAGVAGAPQTPVAAGPTPAPAGPNASSGLALSGAKIEVQPSGLALVQIKCFGTASCSGRLTLTTERAVREKGHKKKVERVLKLGTLSFSIAGNATKTIDVKLNATGRRLLKAGHGKLSGELAIFESGSGTSTTRSQPVRLVGEKARKRK